MADIVIFLCQTELSMHCNENPIYVFPEKKFRSLSPDCHIHVSVSDLYIPRIGPHTVFSCSRIGRPILGIYKSLTETWMWKLGLRLRNSFSGNIFFEFSVLCLCGVRDCQVERFPFEMENVADDLGVSSFDSLCLEPFSDTSPLLRKRPKSLRIIFSDWDYLQPCLDLAGQYLQNTDVNLHMWASCYKCTYIAMYLALDGAVCWVEVWYSLLEGGAVLQAVLATREGVAQCLRLTTNALLFSRFISFGCTYFWKGGVIDH